jgi:hypothetical protein
MNRHELRPHLTEGSPILTRQKLVISWISSKKIEIKLLQDDNPFIIFSPYDMPSKDVLKWVDISN